MSTIRYFIPGDGDVEEHPNVFLGPKATKPGYPPLLGQVRAAFPLPGTYHFRFKSPLIPGYEGKGGMAVWMDCVDDNQPVAIWKNSIIAKVTRVSYDDEESSDEEIDEHFGNGVANTYHPHSAPASVASTPLVTPRSTPPPPTPTPATVHEDTLLNVFDHPTTSSAAPSAHSSSGNLLDGLDDHVAEPEQPVQGEGSLLDMNHEPAPSVHTSSSNHDFFGGATTTASTSSRAAGGHDELLNMVSPPPHQMRPPPTQQQQRQQHMQQQQHMQKQQMNGSFNKSQMQMPMQQQRTNNNGYANAPMPSSRNSSTQSTGNQPQRGNSNGSNNAFDGFVAKNGAFSGLNDFKM